MDDNRYKYYGAIAIALLILLIHSASTWYTFSFNSKVESMPELNDSVTDSYLMQGIEYTEEQKEFLTSLKTFSNEVSKYTIKYVIGIAVGAITSILFLLPKKLMETLKNQEFYSYDEKAYRWSNVIILIIFFASLFFFALDITNGVEKISAMQTYGNLVRELFIKIGLISNLVNP